MWLERKRWTEKKTGEFACKLKSNAHVNIKSIAHEPVVWCLWALICCFTASVYRCPCQSESFACLYNVYFFILDECKCATKRQTNKTKKKTDWRMQTCFIEFKTLVAYVFDNDMLCTIHRNISQAQLHILRPFQVRSGNLLI